jgi:hypothetical protein
MMPSTQLVPGYYVWEVPGKPIAVYLRLETLDRLEAEVLRGLGAIPKRGAEVGGVLLGSLESSPSGTIVRVQDFEPVACSHKRGPTYSLDEEESKTFAETCAHWRPDPSRPMGAVGYYRSNTGDQLALEPEDVALLDQHFPGPHGFALIVKPFATKPCLAGFFPRDNGAFPPASPLEFPFRRRELTGVEPPPRRSSFERRAHVAQPQPSPDPSSPEGSPQADPTAPLRHHELPAPSFAAPEVEAHAESATRFRAAWVWLPLSFVFLLLGLFLGFQLAPGLGPRAAEGAGPELALGLTVTRAEDNLSVRWNRDAPAVRTAQKGVLEIEDGGYAKPVDLDQDHLRNGSIVYRRSSDSVHFRLIVYLSAQLTVTETLVWHP